MIWRFPQCRKQTHWLRHTGLRKQSKFEAAAMKQSPSTRRTPDDISPRWIFIVDLFKACAAHAGEGPCAASHTSFPRACSDWPFPAFFLLDDCVASPRSPRLRPRHLSPCDLSSQFASGIGKERRLVEKGSLASFRLNNVFPSI